MGPIEFQQNFLNRKLFGKQHDILRSVHRGPRKITSVKGCHASGKTFAESGLIPWWLATDPEAIALVVAPTLRQVKTFWTEVSSAISSLPYPTPEPSTTAWRLSEKNYAMGFSSSKGVNAQGFHGKRVLLVTDEAIGIAPDLWDAIEGIRAGGDVTMVRSFNPTVPSGVCFEDFTRTRASVNCITISAFDTPNLEGLTLEQVLQLSEDDLDVAPVPWLTRRRWVKEMYHKWGPNNPRFQSRVLGEFPTQADNAVFSLEWIERSNREPSEKELEQTKGSWIQVGIDVAGPGDDETVGCARVNGIVLDEQAWPDADPRGKVTRWIGDLKAKYISKFPLGPVMIDAVGIGYNFALHIADQGFEVFGFQAGGSPVDQGRFLNAKAEQYWRLRDMYQENYISHSEGTWSEDTAAQLSAILYKETSRGLIMIEPKDEARARGVASPDRAEARMLAFARVTPKERMGVFGEWQQISAV